MYVKEEKIFEKQAHISKIECLHKINRTNYHHIGRQDPTTE